MATYAQLATIAGQAGFQSRVNYAMNVAAVNVYAEDPTTAKHNARVNFADAVVNGKFTLLAAAILVLTNTTIAAEADPVASDNAIPDADLQFAVNSLWNLLANA